MILEDLSPLIEQKIPKSSIKNSNLDLYKLMNKNGATVKTSNFNKLMTDYNKNLKIVVNKNENENNFYKYDKNDLNNFINSLEGLMNFCATSNDMDANQMVMRLNTIKDSILKFEDKDTDYYEFFELLPV